MEDDPNEAILRELHELERVIKGETLNGDYVSTVLDWHVSFKKEFRDDYLVSSFWPVEQSMHIFADGKTGKSLLALWIGANLAIGRDAFTGATIPPQRVYYLDREMTEADVIERLDSMGFSADQLDNLRYDLYPDIPPLDTINGGIRLLNIMQHEECDVGIIDTLARVVKGGENDNDTYRDFHNYTGALLKANHKSIMRLDHEGKVKGTPRGASSKNNDVDLVYNLQRKDDGSTVTLTNTHMRNRGPRKVINLNLHDDPVSYTMLEAFAYVNGAREKARELDDLGAPMDITRRKARELLISNGLVAGRNEVIADALKYRKDKLPWLGESPK